MRLLAPLPFSLPPLLLPLQKQGQAINDDRTEPDERGTKPDERDGGKFFREARRRLLAARFYYWTEVRRRRFDDVMRILSEHEFFVDERSIMDVLRGVSHYLSDLHARRETAAALRRAYPSWSWDSQ